MHAYVSTYVCMYMCVCFYCKAILCMFCSQSGMSNLFYCMQLGTCTYICVCKTENKCFAV